jgi:hypothetical protein
MENKDYWFYHKNGDITRIPFDEDSRQILIAKMILEYKFTISNTFANKLFIDFKEYLDRISKENIENKLDDISYDDLKDSIIKNFIEIKYNITNDTRT